MRFQFILFIFAFGISFALYAQNTKTVIVWQDSTKNNCCCRYQIIDIHNQFIKDTITLINNGSKDNCTISIGINNGYYLHFYNCGTDTMEFTQYYKGDPIIQRTYYESNKLSLILSEAYDSCKNEIGRHMRKYFKNQRIEEVGFDTIVYWKADSNDFIIPYATFSTYLRQGERIHYYENGKIWKIENYYMGDLNGPFYEFNDSGDLMVYGHYKHGSKCGTWYKYDDRRRTHKEKFH